jgi:hypothetical protein
MDKLLYIALGVGVMIVAAVDQPTAEDANAAASAPTVADLRPTRPMQESAAAEWNPPSNGAPTLPQPVNPIPQADDLGGKVLADRFQPDG